MKIGASNADAFVRRPDPAARAVLFHGPDAGLVRERAEALVCGVVDDPGDAFRITELSPARIKDDPALLADEAASLSFTGGRRVVRVRQATDALAAVFEDFLASPPGDALIVVEAGELPARARLRRAFERAGNAAAVACYPDEGGALRKVIKETLSPQGLTLDPAAESYLVAALGGDRQVTRGELDKLATYMGDERRVSLADVEACVGDSAIVTLDGVAIATADGDLAALDRGLARAHLEGAQPVTVLRAVARHLQRLHRAAGRVARGEPLERVVKSLAHHFRIERALRAQQPRWPAPRVVRAMDIVLDAERACKTTGSPAAAICGRALIRVARAARPAKR